MMRSQVLIDKAAIGLSLLCAVHCLAFPLLLVSIPSIAALALDGEAFHIWMVIVVIPSSLYALTVGCRKHGQYRLLLIGCIGLSCLVLALALGHALLGEVGEKALTVIGAIIVSYSHFRNYRSCQHQQDDFCH